MHANLQGYGLRSGGLIASLVVSISHPRSFEILYWCDGLTFIVYAGIASSHQCLHEGSDLSP
jgi:hypothetical protein